MVYPLFINTRPTTMRCMERSKISKSVRLATVVVACMTQTVACAGPADAPTPSNSAPMEKNAERDAWQPKDNEPPTNWVTADSRVALALNCVFDEEGPERLSWDLRKNVDMTYSPGVTFSFRASDTAAVSEGAIYLRSGDGWYRGIFDIPAGGHWFDVRLPKNNMSHEGNPSGWSAIDRIRISIWRAAPGSADCFMADLKLESDPADVVVLMPRHDSSGRGEYIARILTDLGVSESVVIADDVRARKLTEFPVALVLDSRSLGQLRGEMGIYVENGGKLVFFADDALPSGLDALIVSAPLERGNYEKCLAQTAVALGTASPGMWPAIIEHQLDGSERPNTMDEDMATAFADARSIGTKYHDSLASKHAARDESLRAWWIHRPYGIVGSSWEETAFALADNGYNAVIANMLWADRAFYASEVLPRNASFDQHGDQLAVAVEACEKAGIECHAWKVNLQLSANPDPDVVRQLREEKRLQKNRLGQEITKWLCPSHPTNRNMEIDSLVEVVKNYDVDGIQLDYIRYPDDSSCFCDICKESFEEQIGDTITDWPNRVYEDRTLRDQWHEFRRTVITTLVAEISEACRAERPDIKISAAVLSDWSRERARRAQDWKAWCDAGYLDFVCPMNYTTSTELFAELTRKQQAWAGDVPCYPGIGLTTWPTDYGFETMADQVQASRKLNTDGFVIFSYIADVPDDALRRSGLGLTKGN